MIIEKSEIAVFLDRDGTISEETGYINAVDNFSLYRYSSTAIKKLNELGLKVIVITNQASVAKGLCTEDTINSIHKRMRDLLWKDGAIIDAIYFCPHHLEGTIDKYRIDCQCRKPKIGMVLEALKHFKLNLNDSFVVGDKVSDIETGFNSKMKTILVLTGYGKESLKKINENNIKKPNFIAENLLEAVEIIIKEVHSGKKD
jgi:D-glycero-D-manno-heptose 1,7-bisphosphate phosphatase